MSTSPSDGPPTTESNEPYVPASRWLPELTVKAIILGVLLSVVLAAANAYLGLKAGMTVSASIPAAVMSMALLRMFKTSNILENNIVQTAASAGESLAAGVIFTLPALVLLKHWTTFNYVETTIIAALGGMIGVLFTIPLRRALIVDSPLKFPEGVATAEVLKVGDAGGAGIGAIVLGGLIGAIFKFGETGLKLFKGVIEGGWQAGNTIVYAGTNAAPALVAVGYIVGLNIAVLVALGGALNWHAAIPIVAASDAWPVHADVATLSSEEAAAWDTFAVERMVISDDMDDAARAAALANNDQIGAPVAADDYANRIWSKRTRYLGVGAMVIGGLWALIRLWKSLFLGIGSSIRAYRELKAGGTAARTDRDTPIQFVGLALAISAIPVYFVFNHVTGSPGVSAIMAVVMLVAGFLFSAVASYMAGLVGSSNNPISGMTIATLLTSALLLVAMGIDLQSGPAAAIIIGAVVACAAAIGGDNMQDLKAGHLLGATPYKQQIMQAVGVISAALVMAPVLTALLEAYGIGPVAQPGQEPLEAPQASLMESVARGVFENNLPWPMVYIGMVIAAVVIAIDVVLEKMNSSFRTPVLAVAVGIYLPLELSVPILIGGVIAYAVHRVHLARIRDASDPDKARYEKQKKIGERAGLLLAAGLITGEAMLGILLAIPLAIWEGENRIAITFAELTGMGEPFVWPGLAFLAFLSVLLFVMGTRRSV